MNKNQKKIIAVVYKNREVGISAEDIAKQARISKEVVWIEMSNLLKVNAVVVEKGDLFKPSDGKLKMFA